MSGSITALVRTLVAAGATPELILAAVETAEATKDAALEGSREKARARFHKWKANQPANVSKRSQTLANDSKQLLRGEDSSSKKDITGKKESKEDTSPPARSKRAMRLPADWTIPEPWLQEAIDAGLPRDSALSEAKRMHNWSLSNKNGAKLDWLATWRNWFDDKIPKATAPPKKTTIASMWRDEARDYGILPNDPPSQTDRHLDASLPRGQDQGSGFARRIASA